MKILAPRPLAIPLALALCIALPAVASDDAPQEPVDMVDSCDIVYGHGFIQTLKRAVDVSRAHREFGPVNNIGESHHVGSRFTFRVLTLVLAPLVDPLDAPGSDPRLYHARLRHLGGDDPRRER